MKLKKYYIALIVLMFVYLGVFTYYNLFVYGSIIDPNIPILSLTIIIPLYISFKQKNFSSRLLKILSIFLFVVFLVSALVFPKYTYEEAVQSIPANHIVTLRKHVGEKSFVYKGDYYIKTDDGAFSFDINEGTYKGVEDDYK